VHENCIDEVVQGGNLFESKLRRKDVNSSFIDPHGKKPYMAPVLYFQNGQCCGYERHPNFWYVSKYSIFLSTCRRARVQNPHAWAQPPEYHSVIHCVLRPALVSAFSASVGLTGFSPQINLDNWSRAARIPQKDP
jgi:hypothetical protein